MHFRKGAWSIGSVRASTTGGSEFEPSFRHPFLCGGSLAGPCNPMRLGHDCCSQVRREVLMSGERSGYSRWDLKFLLGEVG